jgi:hypothetical protein
MTHTKCQSQRTFRTLCLTSSFLFMIGIITAFVPIVPFFGRFFDNDFASQIISVLGWSVAGSAVLPELCIDFMQLKDATVTPRRPDYGVHSRYGCAKDVFLCLIQSVMFVGGCVVMGLAEYRVWDTSSSSSSSSSSESQHVVDWRELYLIGSCCMTASALLAISVTGCARGCTCCCCLEVPLPTTTIPTTTGNDGPNIYRTSSTATIDPYLYFDDTLAAAAAGNILLIVANGLYLGGSLVLLIACVTDGWCNDCMHGYLLQKITYCCWVAASILWTIADAMLPTRCEQRNQHGQQHDHHQRHDPTPSAESMPSSGRVVPDQEMQLE